MFGAAPDVTADTGVAGLLGRDHTTSQMTYDLRRLRLHGLIERLPHTYTYVTTAEGLRVALFYTKVHARASCGLFSTPRSTASARRAPARGWRRWTG